MLINFTSCVLCVERNLMRIKMFYMGEKPPRAQLALAIVFLFFYTLSLFVFSDDKRKLFSYFDMYNNVVVFLVPFFRSCHLSFSLVNSFFVALADYLF